jgi:hypothetical protein
MVSSLNASYTALLHTRALLRMAFLRHDFLTPLSLSLSLSLSLPHASLAGAGACGLHRRATTPTVR